MLVAAYRKRKIRIVDANGMLAECRDTIAAPFTCPSVDLSYDSTPGWLNNGKYCGQKLKRGWTVAELLSQQAAQKGSQRGLR